MALALWLWSPAAFADPKDDARRHFTAGMERAAAQDYQGALEEFLAAQDAWPHPNTLNNIARTYYNLGDYANALRYYRDYADIVPEKAADVEGVIAVLEGRLRQQAAAAAPPAPATPTPAPVTSPAARTAELDRLAAIAAELDEIRRSLAEAPAGTASADTSGDASPTDTGDTSVGIPASSPSQAEPAPLPDDGAFLSDAYERVVVTASRYGQAPLDSPSTVTILTEEDLRLGAIFTIPDLLRRVAGVDVMEITAGQPEVSIRGFNRELSNKVLVLVDGRSAYLDFLGNTLWHSLPLSLDEIERVEIIRGPGSAIYGANAMTGVVNIITRQPGRGRTLAHLSMGHPALVQGTVLADGRRDRTAWRVSAGWDQVGRWSRDQDLASSSALEPLLDEESIAPTAARATGRIDQAFLDKGLASVSAGWSQGTGEIVTIGALGEFGLEYTTGYARADLAYGPVHLRSFYNAMSGLTGPWAEYHGATTLDTTFDSDTVDVELEALGDFATGPVDHRINAGAGYRYKRIAWDYLMGEGAPIDEHHVNAFFQETARVGPLSLVGSLRVDRHPLVDLSETVSPRGAAILRVAPRTSVRAGGGTAFRNPTFLETYLDLAQPTDVDGISVRDVGLYLDDPDGEISPERLLTAEIGVHDESSAIHVADLALYVNRVTDLIGLTSVEPQISAFDPDLGGFYAGTTGFTNLSPVYTAVGGELDLRMFPVDGLDVYGNVAIERITQDDGGVKVVDESTSLLKANVGVMYRTPIRLDVSTHLSYASPQVWGLREFDDTGTVTVVPQPVDGRVLLSARIGYRPLKSDRLELAANGWNLLEAAGDGYREHPKGQLVRARMWGELIWRF